MDQVRWRRLQPILDEVLDLPPDERRIRLEAACATDPGLRADVEAFLEADAETKGVLDDLSGEFLDDVLRERQRAAASGNAEERLLPGARVAGRYRIVSLLGRGGMGEVYRADDLKLGQTVALKFLPIALQQRPEYLRRLLDEARLARQVSHPNVCRVYDIGEWDQRHFLSMEYVDGEDLASLVTRIGYLPREKAADISRQLCAGLDAAHQVGILHRDLKPSNVMLDGRGRVRITDFGLAALAADLDAQESARAGTPAYMAPEQLEGREATTRTDIYALGLVLYELFTGRRAFPAGTLDELRRLREESSPAHPSLLVEGFDPVVERAILRCLEKDPTLRPALAFGVLGATAAMLLVLTLLSDGASILGWVAWPRSAAALEDNARAILSRLGYDAKPADRAHLFLVNFGWMRYVLAHDESPGRWDRLRQPGQFGMMYAYRQSPDLLVPQDPNGLAFSAPPRAGDAQVATDLRGKLIALVVLPNDADPPVEASPPADWGPLFREAGLDPARFQPAAPTRNAWVAADERAAWTGTLDDFGGYPVRVEAAAHRGRPVFFELVVPWDPYWEPSPTIERRSIFSSIGYGLLVLFAIGSTGVLAVRNWLSGRGDRFGALRVAGGVFLLRLAAWSLGGDHVPSAVSEWRLLLDAVGVSLTDGLAAWCFYLALEPYGRRLHPRLLVSWTRLLRGKLRDPLVGRDILAGVAVSTVVILLWGQLHVVLPHALGMQAPPPPMEHPLGNPPLFDLLSSPPFRTLLGGRHVLAAYPGAALGAAGVVAFLMMALLGLHLLLRRSWAAVVAILAVGATLAWPSAMSQFGPFGIACSLAGIAAMVWALRFGLVGLLTSWFCLTLWMNFPVTADVDAPHFGTGLAAVILIAALGAYGAFTTSRSVRVALPR